MAYPYIWGGVGCVRWGYGGGDMGRGIGTMLRIIVHFAHKIYYRCAFVLHRRIG